MAGHVYALLVGIDAYQPRSPGCRGCVDDVTPSGRCCGAGWRPRSSVGSRDRRDATRARSCRRSRRTSGGRAADAALFAYSGHGAQAAPQGWRPIPHRNETLVLVTAAS